MTQDPLPDLESWLAVRRLHNLHLRAEARRRAAAATFNDDGDPYDAYDGEDSWRPTTGDMLAAYEQRTRITIRCHGQGCHAERAITGGFGVDRVRAQMRLYHEGWRRDPDTARDYCPPHVPDTVPR